MANIRYDAGCIALASAQIQWGVTAISAVLVDTALYTVSASHTSLSSVPAGARIATTALSGMSVSAQGGCMANATTFTSVSGASVEAIVLFYTSGNEATSTLILYMDTLTGLPFTPDGTNVIVGWNSGIYGIFRA